MKKLYLLLFLIISIFVACVSPEDEMPILMKELQTGNAKQKSQAALRIGRIGSPHANQATGELIKMLNHRNPGLRSSAAYALRKIDTPQAREALEKAK